MAVLASYFLLLTLIARLTSRGAGNEAFFIGERRSPWYVVAFGMIGASLSGVTFISVPGWVGESQFSYFQMVLGYLPGYAVIALVLMPLYYRLQLTSIYGYLGQRFGPASYRTGAGFFLLSRSIGSAARLYLVALVLQVTLFDAWGVPFAATVAVTIAFIWTYTHKGGIKTIIWTDTLQTAFMIAAAVLTALLIGRELGLGPAGIWERVGESGYAKVLFTADPDHPRFFWKQFLAGMFIAIAMTGLDQDMMQKNLSCRNIREAQKNMFSFSAVLVVVNLLFLALGALLFLFAEEKGIALPERSDELFPLIATGGHLPAVVGVMFLLGLIAAAYSSADSALTALTTSFCVDILDIAKRPEATREGLRRRVHVGMSVALAVIILIFREWNDASVISAVFTIAGYTYGPLLGLYAFGLLTGWQVRDAGVPVVALLAPVLTWVFDANSVTWFNGYRFGFELLLLNGALTFLGLMLLRTPRGTGGNTAHT